MTDQKKIERLCKAVDTTLERLDLDQHQAWVTSKQMKADLEGLKCELSNLRDSLHQEPMLPTLEDIADRVSRQRDEAECQVY